MATAPTEEESNITGAVATHWKEQEREELILNIHDLERAAERKLPKVARGREERFTRYCFGGLY